MADTPPVDQAYKMAALQALATGGSQAKAAVDQARTAMQTSQGEALKQAASNSAAYGLGQAGTDALQAPINTAYNQRLGSFDKVTAPSVARFTDLQAPTAKVFDTKAAATLSKLSSGGSGGGGGGRGGGSNDWFTSDLADQYDTKANLKSYISTQPGQSAKYGDGTAAQKAAIALGVPQKVAQAWYPTTSQGTQINNWLQTAAQHRQPNSFVQSGLEQNVQAGQMSAQEAQYWYQKYQNDIPYAPKAAPAKKKK